ncbi:16531_t:CDS:1, partial [Cetraspora pellucida]
SKYDDTKAMGSYQQSSNTMTPKRRDHTSEAPNTTIPKRRNYIAKLQIRRHR